MITNISQILPQTIKDVSFYAKALFCFVIPITNFELDKKDQYYATEQQKGMLIFKLIMVLEAKY